jgi:hypothetical protein
MSPLTAIKFEKNFTHRSKKRKRVERIVQSQTPATAMDLIYRMGSARVSGAEPERAMQNQQVSGIAPAALKRKQEKKSNRVVRSTAGGANRPAAIKLAGPQRADKNRQRRSSNQLTQHKAYARNGGGPGNPQIQGEGGHEFPLWREHSRVQS